MHPKRIILLISALLASFVFIILFSNHLINQQLTDTLPSEKISTQANQKNNDQPDEDGSFLSHQKTFLIDEEEDLLAPMKKEPKSTFADPSFFSGDSVQEPSIKSPILVQ